MQVYGRMAVGFLADGFLVPLGRGEKPEQYPRITGGTFRQVYNNNPDRYVYDTSRQAFRTSEWVVYRVLYGETGSKRNVI